MQDNRSSSNYCIMSDFHISKYHSIRSNIRIIFNNNPISTVPRSYCNMMLNLDIISYNCSS